MADYVAGLAVECILLAYLERKGLARQDRHDLLKLAKRSGFLESFRDEESRDRLAGALHDVATRWANSHRYRSEDSLRTFLTKRKMYRVGRRHIRNVVEFHAREISSAANAIVAAGVENW
jgi:hypothetical protein